MLGADTASLWVPVSVVLLALLLDGLDGRLARSTGQLSVFGARFDMEIDALLALVVAVLLWQLEKVGVWVLGLGALRYLFIGASLVVPALDRPLFPSFRRKLVCVIQVAGLCLMLVPLVSPRESAVIGIVALTLLCGSFLRDVLWLLDRADRTDTANSAHRAERTEPGSPPAQ